MSKTKLVAALTSTAIFATALSAAPSATAVQLHGEERSGRPICVATLSDSETQVSKDFFQTLVNEHLALEAELRALFPELQSQFENVDQRQAAGETFIMGYPSVLQSAITDAGFDYGERSLFFFTNSPDHVKYEDFAKNGYAVEVEIAPNWTKAQFENYPFGVAPAIPAGTDWGRSQFSYAIMAEKEINQYGISELEYSVPSAALRPIINPHKVRMESISDQFNGSWDYYALDRAATACLNSYKAGDFPEPEAIPTTTYAPTVTVTAAPSTVTATPEPTTVTVEPSTVVVEPTPVTTTVATETVTVTPAPATSTAATKTVTVTPAPVTTTKAQETVIVTPEPTTVTTTPTVTVAADAVEITESKDEPAEKNSEGMGMLPIIIAILAAIGGIAGLIFSSPALLPGLI